MIVLIDTSTPTCHVSMVEGEWRYDATWEAGRELAKGLLRFLDEQLEGQKKTWNDVTGLVVFKGPGSFTGLRISATVFNTLAATHGWPIVGSMGENWQHDGLLRLQHGENDAIVLPEYGGEANITKPRK
jgi:tRNA threonylcarbamoyladenosine biosynthesis protein TsaB